MKWVYRGNRNFLRYKQLWRTLSCSNFLHRFVCYVMEGEQPGELNSKSRVCTLLWIRLYNFILWNQPSTTSFIVWIKGRPLLSTFSASQVYWSWCLALLTLFITTRLPWKEAGISNEFRPWTMRFPFFLHVMLGTGLEVTWKEYSKNIQCVLLSSK